MPRDVEIDIDDETLRLLALKARLAGEELERYLHSIIKEAARHVSTDEDFS